MPNTLLSGGYKLKYAVENTNYKEILGLLIDYSSALSNQDKLSKFATFLEILQGDEMSFGIQAEGFEEIANMMMHGVIKQRLDDFFDLCRDNDVDIDYSYPEIER